MEPAGRARLPGLLALPPGLRWLDVGCGTGALTATVLAGADPPHVTWAVHGIAPS
ncbi:hypothetical protein [Micromonospora sp. NPDC005299]|uniref:hypothetical protein n=1 Tax=Micromonospora sp. NPDC005299 TaxID=3364231 RepID=UPI003678885D